MSSLEGAGMFKEFEEELNCKINFVLQHLLDACGYNNYFSLQDVGETDIQILEAYALNDPSRYESLFVYTDKKMLSPGYKKLIIALGKHASYKAQCFTSDRFKY